MKPRYFAGVDISKLTLDVALMNEDGEVLNSYKIANSESAIKDFFLVIKGEHKCTPRNTFYCAEDMGLYATYLTKVLVEKKVKFCLESSLRIKRSMGIQRGKNDAIDAIRIARYACANYGSLRIWEEPRKCVLELKNLSTIRRRLLKIRKMLTQVSKIENYYVHEFAETSHFHCSNTINAIHIDIEKVDRSIDEIIASDERLSRLTELITSIPRVGRIIATQVIITTNEFKWISSPKKFASLCGIAPFERSSGSSLNRRGRISYMANKELKMLFHLAALGYTMPKAEKHFLGKYYRRKIAEGKNALSAINAVRNKIVHRIFACVRDDSFYVDK